MKVICFSKRRIVAAVVALGAWICLQNISAAPPAPVGMEAGVQVLMRGPIHEAFAETVMFDPEPGIVVSKSPPAAIQELPPDQRPEGANVAWIPGYWAWDDERSDFLWVSGVWRVLPPGRQWVPGYWGKSPQGFQWTSGYWADALVKEVDYLSEPPATVEAGPNVASPSPDSTWLPGCWIWQTNRYAWRPGFWAAVQPDWIWVPAHYVAAPLGYIFVEGYWDYSIGRRGVLFAPVVFDAAVYTRPGFSYSPATVIDLGVFADHLFLRPQYQHYYFGDYYAANYQAAGYYPSYSYNSSRYGYDPIYAHARWQHRQDGQWDRRIAADFQNRRDHEDARPPRTWSAQRALNAVGPRSQDAQRQLAVPFSELTRSKESPLRFQPVDPAERQKLGQHGQEVQRFREERQKLETRTAAPSAASPSKQSVPARVPLPRSPIVARPVTELGKGYTPPKIYEAPKPDPRIEAKPRPARSPEQPQQHTVNRIPTEKASPQPQPGVGRPPRAQDERHSPQPAGHNQEKPKEKGQNR